VYGKALLAGLKSFYFQRCRTALPEPYAVWEGKAYTRSAPCHVHEDVAWDYGTYPEKKKKWQLEAGWHDAGNYEMYIPSTGPTAQALLIAYESHPALFGEDSNIPESHNKIPDILDEARWGLTWILSMQEPDTGAFRAREAVFDWSDPDPVKERKPRWVSGVGSASTAKATAVLAQAARVFQRFDPAFAARCEKAARAGFAFLVQHPERIFVDGKGSDQPLWDDSPEYHEVGARFTAAVEVYRSFRLPAALTLVRSFLPDPETQPAKFVEGGWPNLSRFAFMSLFSDLKAPAELRAEAKQRLLAAVETMHSGIDADGYSCATTPKGYYWGHNANLLEKASHARPMALDLGPQSERLLDGHARRQRSRSHLLDGMGTRRTASAWLRRRRSERRAARVSRPWRACESATLGQPEQADFRSPGSQSVALGAIGLVGRPFRRPQLMGQRLVRGHRTGHLLRSQLRPSSDGDAVRVSLEPRNRRGF
jgi:endoglucanase